MDAVTSYGVAELRAAAWNVDIVVSGSQKATATPPGLGFVLFSPQAEARLIKDTPKGFYLDLERELRGQKQANTPQTPAINLVYALDASLDRLLSVPLEVLWAEKKRQNDALIAAGEALGCRSWASRPSPAVAVLVPPEGLGGKQVAGQLASMNQRALPGQAPTRTPCSASRRWGTPTVTTPSRWRAFWKTPSRRWGSSLSVARRWRRPGRLFPANARWFSTASKARSSLLSSSSACKSVRLSGGPSSRWSPRTPSSAPLPG